MLYFRFILSKSDVSSMDGPDREGRYHGLRVYKCAAGGKPPVLLSENCSAVEIRELLKKHGRYAVVSFEGDMVLQRSVRGEDSVLQRISSDKDTFETEEYWKDGSIMLFVRKDCLCRPSALLSDAGAAIMSSGLLCAGIADDADAEAYCNGRLAGRLGFGSLAHDGERLFYYTCMRLSGAGLAILAAVFGSVMLNYFILSALASAKEEVSRDISAMNVRNGHLMEQERNVAKLQTSIGRSVSPPASYLMDRLSLIRPEGILYTEVRMSPGNVRVTGTVSVPGSLPAMTALAGREEYVRSVSIVSVKTDRSGRQVFIIDMVLE